MDPSGRPRRRRSAVWAVDGDIHTLSSRAALGRWSQSELPCCVREIRRAFSSAGSDECKSTNAAVSNANDRDFWIFFGYGPSPKTEDIKDVTWGKGKSEGCAIRGKRQRSRGR